MKYHKFVKPAWMNPYVCAVSENPIPAAAAAAKPPKQEKYSRTLSRQKKNPPSTSEIYDFPKIKN